MPISGVLKRFFSLASSSFSKKNTIKREASAVGSGPLSGHHNSSASNSVKNMTKNGKIARFSSIVVAGSGNGGLGTGHAKHDSASEAVLKAGRLAVKNIQYFNRWQDRTIFHDDYVKFKATKLYIRPAPPNTGRRCHPTIAEMCRCVGIKDISAKVHGSSHPMNVMKAFLLALERQKSPEQVSAESGMKCVDVLKVFETNCRQGPLRGSHQRV